MWWAVVGGSHSDVTVLISNFFISKAIIIENSYNVCDVPYGSRYMKSVYYHAPRTMSESCYVIFGLMKIKSRSLNKTGGTLFKIF